MSNREQRRNDKRPKPKTPKVIQVREDYVEIQCNKAASFATEATINALAYSLVRNQNVTQGELEEITKGVVTTLTGINNQELNIAEIKNFLKKEFKFNFGIQR